MTMGQRIAERRKMLGISQETLGEKMGVSRQAISKWEADAAIPEIDKLIALSKLFGVTVGWLLGTEDTQQTGAEGISEEQMKTIEELIRRYTQPRKPQKAEPRQIILALCAFCLGLASLILTLSNLSRNNSIFPNYQSQLSDLSRENSIIQDQLSYLNDKLEELTEGEKLVNEYSFTPVAWNDYKGATIHFTAVPTTVRPDDAVNLTVRLNDTVVATALCERDDLGYKASVDLPAADGYAYYIQVTHSDGTQEQSLLLAESQGYDVTAVYLASMLTCTAGAEVDDWSFTRGTLRVDPFVYADGPTMLAEGDRPVWVQLDMVLLCNGEELFRRECLEKAMDWMDSNMETVAVPDSVAPEKYHVLLWLNARLEEMSFALPDLSTGDRLELRIEAELSNGLTAQSTAKTWNYQNGNLIDES